MRKVLCFVIAAVCTIATCSLAAVSVPKEYTVVVAELAVSRVDGNVCIPPGANDVTGNFKMPECTSDIGKLIKGMNDLNPEYKFTQAISANLLCHPGIPGAASVRLSSGVAYHELSSNITVAHKADSKSLSIKQSTEVVEDYGYRGSIESIESMQSAPRRAWTLSSSESMEPGQVKVVGDTGSAKQVYIMVMGLLSGDMVAMQPIKQEGVTVE